MPWHRPCRHQHSFFANYIAETQFLSLLCFTFRFATVAAKVTSQLCVCRKSYVLVASIQNKLYFSYVVVEKLMIWFRRCQKIIFRLRPLPKSYVTSLKKSYDSITSMTKKLCFGYVDANKIITRLHQPHESYDWAVLISKKL